MRINNNLMAMNTHRQLGAAGANGARSMEKLSSGSRINKAGDDAAGLSISEKMRGQIRGLTQASKNAQDGISLIQTAEGALSETHAILQRMRELAVQSSTDTNTGIDRGAIQEEMKQLKSEVDRIGNNTEFNTMKLIDGSVSGSQIGGKGTSLGEATAASISTGNLDPALFDTDVTSFQVNLDGKVFDITAVDVTDGFTFFSDFETKLNAAIDTHNAANPNDKVEYAKFEINVTDATTMDFSITSGTTGSNSKLEIKAIHEDTKTIGTAGELGEAFVAAGAVNGSDGKFSTDAATDITALNATDKLKMNVNGNAIDVTLATVGAATYTAGTSDVQDFADDLKTDINNALNEYKALTGKDLGTVDVKVKDGALEITSSKAEEVSLQFLADAISEKVGLAGTSTTGTGGLTFQIGANKGQNINLQINDMRTSALSISDVDLSTREGADNAIEVLDNAIKSVSQERSKLGAVQNRLDHSIKNLDTSSENLQAAESRVRDVDMAKEMMELTKNNILQQAAQAMLAQANQQPQGVLQLLR